MSSPTPFTICRTLLTAANLVPAANVSWPNEKFTKPASPALWIHAECVGDMLTPIELGSGGAWEEEGRFLCHIMAPLNTGTDNARTLGKNIANVFRGVVSSNVVFRSASIGNGEMAEADGMYWRLSVVIDWIYQDIAT